MMITACSTTMTAIGPCTERLNAPNEPSTLVRSRSDGLTRSSPFSVSWLDIHRLRFGQDQGERAEFFFPAVPSEVAPIAREIIAVSIAERIETEFPGRQIN